MRHIRALVVSWLVLPCVAQSIWEARFHSGDALERQGRYAAALNEFEQALAEVERFGAADYRLPLTLHNAAAVDRELGRYVEADRRLRRAVSLWQGFQPPRPAQLASSLNNLAAVQVLLNRPSRAEALYREAYALRVAALGPDDALTAASLHGLAALLHQLGRYTEAEPLYARAIFILERAAPNSLALADILHNRGMLDRDTRRNGAAAPLLLRAIAVYESVAPEHPKLAVILRNYAELQTDAAAADALFRRSLQICEKALPADHPQTGIILGAYAKFLQRHGRKPEARAFAARAQAILAKSAKTNGLGFTVDVGAI